VLLSDHIVEGLWPKTTSEHRVVRAWGWGGGCSHWRSGR